MATPEIVNILDQLFSLCRIPFVTDFLFKTDPVADIAILTAPVQTEHSIAARISVSGTEVSTQFAHVFDFSSDIFFASVPAFSVGPITVGFCTQEPAAGSTDDAEVPLGSDRVRCSRYVRDDSNGVFLLLSEDSVTGITELDCMSHQSARQRTRIVARFNTLCFRTCLRTPNGVLNPDDIMRSLSYLSVAHERRKCPICAADDNGQCDCILPFKPPSHPLCFKNERRNMSLHTGRYYGGSTVRLFNTLQPFIVTNLSTKSIIKGTVDKDIIHRMNKFAVQICMSKLVTNPLNMLIPGGLAGLPLSGHQHVAGLLEGVQPVEETIWGVFSDDMNNGVTMNSGLLENANDTPESTPPLSLMGDGSRDYLKEFVDTNTNGKKPDNVNSGEATPNSNQKSSSEGDSTGRSMDHKELKAELRRQRNREAAAKSNIKRKIRNEALRKHLAEANKRANELRAIEKRLREENVKLRSMANKKKVKISSHLTHIQIANS